MPVFPQEGISHSTVYLVPGIWQVADFWLVLSADPPPSCSRGAVQTPVQYRHLAFPCFPSLNYHSLMQGIMGKLGPKGTEHFVLSHIAGKPADKTSFNLGSLALVARITTALPPGSLPLCNGNHGISHTSNV